jgi:hypothetical protein
MGAAQGSGAVIFGNSTDTTDIASRIVIGGNGPASDELGDSAISLASRMISKSKTKTASVPYASTQHHVPQVQVIVDKSPHGWLEDRAPQST